MQMRLPDVKKRRLQDRVHTFLQCRKSASKRDILSLVGELSHACKVIRPGRIFLSRLIDLSCSRPSLNDWIRLNHEAKADLSWWD